MTARPWGTTGRVTLEGTHWGYAVKMTGAMVGVVVSVAAPSGPWRASIHFDVDITGAKEAHLPSLDAAVMWVLRRADAEVWRQERGPVWRVKSGHVPPDCHRCHYHWRIYAPGGSEYTYSGATDTREGWEWALREVFDQLTGAAHRDLS